MANNNHLCECPANVDISGVTQNEICTQEVVQIPCDIVDEQNNFLALDKIRTYLCENTFVAGANLTGQNLTAFVPTLFSSTGLTTVFAWTFKDSDGNFIDLKHVAQNANNTVIEVTSTDDLTNFDIYFYGQV
jgi:hypothetical protein